MHFTSTLYTNTPAMQFFKLYSFKKAAVNCDCQSFQFGFVRFFATTCRAVLLPRFGGPEVLELCSDVEVPQLKPNQVLVRTRAVSVNPLDTRVSYFFLFTRNDLVLWIHLFDFVPFCLFVHLFNEGPVLDEFMCD